MQGATAHGVRRWQLGGNSKRRNVEDGAWTADVLIDLRRRARMTDRKAALDHVINGVICKTDQKINRIRPAKYTVDGVWGGRIGYFALLAA